jgi:hypothetical protein
MWHLAWENARILIGDFPVRYTVLEDVNRWPADPGQATKLTLLI